MQAVKNGTGKTKFALNALADSCSIFKEIVPKSTTPAVSIMEEDSVHHAIKDMLSMV